MIDQEQLTEALKLNGVDSSSPLANVDAVLALFHYSPEDRLKTIAYLRTQGWALTEGVAVTPEVVAAAASPVAPPVKPMATSIPTPAPTPITVPPVASTPVPPVAPAPAPVTPPAPAPAPMATPVATPTVNPLTGSVTIPQATPAPAPAVKMTYTPPAGSTGTVPPISVAPMQGGTFVPPPMPAPTPTPTATAVSTPQMASPMGGTPLGMNAAPSMAVPAEEKKDGYGMAIFLVVVIFVLLLGGIVGYAYVQHMGPFAQPAPAEVQNVIN